MDCTPVFKKVKLSSRSLKTADKDLINKVIRDLSDRIVEETPSIIASNKKDTDRMVKSDPKYDRLLLSPDRIRAISEDLKNVAGLMDPTGLVLSETSRPNGLKIRKISVPFGVIGIIFEARPNVVLDVFSLCLKSRNGCILKGGTDAKDSNERLVEIIKETLRNCGLDDGIVTLLPPGRTGTAQMLNAVDYIDLVIPRGSKGLIDFVRDNAKVPVIETGAGICHTYFDKYGDRVKGREIIFNAKTRRVSVCNALDCLIIHKDRLNDLGFIVGKCADSSVIIFADREAYRSLKGKYPEKLLKHAVKDSFGTEFLSYQMAVKTVSGPEDALLHIEKKGSRHSEAIITENEDARHLFFSLVDASSVYSNASTAFTDGAEFGLGAEIGISTQKLHARGPMGLQELTTYKWIIEGEGQIRT